MGSFDPFIPLVKQVMNKVKHRNPGLTVPSWYRPPAVSKPTGQFNPGAAESKSAESNHGKATYDPGQAESLQVQSGKARPFTPGRAQSLAAEAGKSYNDGKKVDDPNPYGNYYFALEITGPDNKKGVEIAHFRECSGLKNACTPFEIEEGGVNSKSYKRPGQAKWENIVLKYATSASTFLLAWRDAWLTGTDNWKDRESYSGAITLMDNAGNPIKRYEFQGAWPVSWEGPAFNAGSSDIAVETLEIAHQGLKVVDPKPTT